MNRMYVPTPYFELLMSYGAGVIAFEKCEFDCAEENFRHCIRHNPENWRAKYLLVMTLIRKEEFSKARSLLLEIIDLCPNEDIRDEAIRQQRLIESASNNKICTLYKKLMYKNLALAN